MSFQCHVFGQVRPEYTVPVFNERAVRAGAGILFFWAMVAFMNACLSGNFAPTRVFLLASCRALGAVGAGRDFGGVS